MQKIDLIYITSLSHSGSTLVDRILDLHDEIESVGEIIHLNNYLLNNNNCSCGKNIKNCEYWNRIINHYQFLLKKNNINDNMYDISISGKEYSIFRKYYSFFRGYKNFFKKDEIEYYGIRNYFLFKSIRDITKKKFVLDSSKNPLRLLLLKNSKLFNIKVIYLYRDARASLESMKRKSIRNSKYNYPGVFKAILDIYRSNLYIRSILNSNFLIPEVFPLLYENFTKSLQGELKKISSFLNIKYLWNRFIREDESGFKILSSNKTIHNIGGNRIRLEELDRIIFINKWVKGLNQYEKLVFTCFLGKHLNQSFLNRIKAYSKSKIFK